MDQILDFWNIIPTLNHPFLSISNSSNYGMDIWNYGMLFHFNTTKIKNSVISKNTFFRLKIVLSQIELKSQIEF